MEPENRIKKCGFASMSLRERWEISSKGGRSSRDKGTLYRFTSEDCRNGGIKTSQDRDHMAEIGSKGYESARDNGTLHRFTSEDVRKAWKRAT